MKYATRTHAASDTLQLQSIGHVVGQPAGNIKKGDVLMWNFGMTSKVDAIVKETAKSIVIATSEKGVTYQRRMLKSRLVCILED